MDAKLLLLGLLRQQNMHGYQLYEFIDRGFSVCTDLKKPTAYYLLNKMAEEGLISEDHIQEGNRPLRRVYTLTEKGEAEYQRLLRANLAIARLILAAMPVWLLLEWLDALLKRLSQKTTATTP